MQKYRFVLPRRNFKPARPDPWRFQTRPTRPVKISNPADPTRFSKNGPEPYSTRSGTRPDGSGRVGLQDSNGSPLPNETSQQTDHVHIRSHQAFKYQY